MSDERKAPERLTETTNFNGLTWVPGRGDSDAEIVFLAESPNRDVIRRRSAFTGREEEVLLKTSKSSGLLDKPYYMTYAVKYKPRANKKVGPGDVKTCAQLLFDELNAIKPKYVVCTGLHALKALFGKSAKTTEYTGALADCRLVDPSYAQNPGMAVEAPAFVDFKVFTVTGLGALNSQPWRIPALKRLLDHLRYRIQNKDEILVKEPDFAVCDTDEKVRLFVQHELSKPERIYSLDLEWNGETWMHPDRKVVTMQFGLSATQAVIIELFDEQGNRRISDEAIAEIRRLLEDPKTSVFGHNISSDCQWLLSYGIDIRKRITFDTILAESLLNSQGPFGLEELISKYTWIHRYDFELTRWKNATPADVYEHGYLRVPRRILFPYGAWDVCSLFLIAEQQIPLLQKYGLLTACSDYPCSMTRLLQTAVNIVEIETTGLTCDVDMLDTVQTAYTRRLAELETTLKVMVDNIERSRIRERAEGQKAALAVTNPEAAALVDPDALAAAAEVKEFNFRSNQQVSRLLFDTLGLTPIKTTKGKDWRRAVSNQPEEEQALHNPSTDKTTLEILEGAHPVIKVLENTNRLETLVKTFLRDNEEADCSTRGGGLRSKIWPDGRFHPHFTVLTKTGRFNCSRPNLQNWPKRADKYLEDIFGKGNVPSPMRHIVVPPPGHVFIEADFTQAELFVLAYLSGDKNMIRNLETPGLDLHDNTAITAFKMRVLHSSTQQPVNEQEMLELARRDIDAFKAVQAGFLYLDARNKVVTREKFSEGPRVGAKALNFGARLPTNAVLYSGQQPNRSIA